VILSPRRDFSSWNQRISGGTDVKTLPTLTLAALLAWLPSTVRGIPSEDAAPGRPLEPVFFSEIKIHGFWRDQFKRLTETWIPHCVKQMEPGGEGQELLNLVHAAEILQGKPAGEFTGRPWSDAYVYNTIESICLALAVDPQGDQQLAGAQAALRAKLEEWIPIVLAAQMDDGYIHSFHTVNKLDRYTDINRHEFYVQGYFLEAGVAHCRATGGKDRRLYDAARKCADHLCDTFGPPPKRNWVYGHAGMGCALCRLARLVNEVEGPGRGDKYFQLAKFLFDHRHTEEQHRNAYRQSHLPVPEQADAVGHAVRATYFYTGIADLGMLTGDKAYLRAVDKIWTSAAHRRMYVTGGVGSTHQGEAFGEDYQLPSQSAYCESCAGCGLSFWSDRMHRIHRAGQYVDVQERVLYNNILGAIELSGKNFFYQNPLASGARRYSWHNCPCCVGNIPRALIAVKDLMYSLNAEKDTLFVNHFVASDGVIPDVAGTSLRVEQQTDYPWQGGVAVVLHPAETETFTLKIRIPDRGESLLYTPRPELKDQFKIKLNGEPLDVEAADGYVDIRRQWRAGDRIDLELPLDVQRIYADHRVEDCRGHVALARGPLVYNIEDADHGGQCRAVSLAPDVPLKAVWKPDLLGGVMAVVGPDGGILAVPNCVRLNRGGWSQVWIAELPELAEPLRRPTIASTAAVTTSFQTYEGRFSTDAIHDQREPEQSDERGTPLFHWWPHLGTREWVQYDFEKPQRVGSVEVYWYDDRAWGACRQPESWQVLYRDAGQWKPVQDALQYGVERDRFNRTTFEPVTTDALRLDVQLQEGCSAGILEWRVE